MKLHGHFITGKGTALVRRPYEVMINDKWVKVYRVYMHPRGAEYWIENPLFRGDEGCIPMPKNWIIV